MTNGTYMACLLGALATAALADGSPSQVQWRAYAADNASSKYLPLRQINAKNVSRLREAWVWSSPDNAVVAEYNSNGLKLWPHAYESTPLMIGGLLYVSTSLGQVAAIDAAAGRTVWVHHSDDYLTADGNAIAYPPNLGLVARGVAYWQQGRTKRLFFATGAATLLALDPQTGNRVADFGTGGSVDLKQGLRRAVSQAFYGVTSPPLVCGNVVIVGSQVLDFPLRTPMPPGDVRGFDARTGSLLWTFHTVPEPGEAGADTWDAQGLANTGSANVWAPMSCDDALGMAYLPVSTPSNDFYGGNRAGGNLFADSLVALNAQTGKLVWHYQLVHHGLWDYDTPAAPNLVDIKVNGRAIKAVAQVTKQGFVYVFDRVTGQPVWPIIERPVPQSQVPGEQTAPTQPIPTRPLPFDRQGLTGDDLIDFTPALRQEALATLAPYSFGPLFTPPALDLSAQNGPRGAILMPGDIGGGSWTGAAVDPRAGILYVPSITRPATVVLSAFPPTKYAGLTASLRMPDGLPIVKPPYGRLTAIDLNTGDHLWVRPVGNGPVDHPALKSLGLKNLGWDRRSFFIVTDGLLFGAQEGIADINTQPLSPYTTFFTIHSDESFLWALDPRTGEKLLELPIHAGNASGSPMTYETNGRQFIVVPVGGAGTAAKLVAFALP